MYRTKTKTELSLLSGAGKMTLLVYLLSNEKISSHIILWFFGPSQ